MKTIGIICALESELKRIREALNGKPEKVGLYTFYVADSGKKRIIAAQCGIGKVNAAACAQMLISNFQVDCILNSGVSGSLSDKLHIMDIVAATDVAYHDMLARFLAGDYFPGTAYFPADEQISALTAEICAEQGIPCLRGRVVSGDQFVIDSAKKSKIIEDTQGITTEMEGAAIGHVCYLNQIPFGIIRCISDGADDQGNNDFDTFVIHAAERCAGITLAMIERL